MDLQLTGKTALVTGGSEGIGKGITLALAKEGVDVAICARRKDVLEATASEIARATNRKIVAIPADLRKDADAKNFIEQAHTALGRVDIMINNAGSAAGGVIEHLTEDDWEKGLQLKFMGYVRCLRYVLPIMVKQGGGRCGESDRQRWSEAVVLGDLSRSCQCSRSKSYVVARWPVRQERHQLLRSQPWSRAYRALGRTG